MEMKYKFSYAPRILLHYCKITIYFSLLSVNMKLLLRITLHGIIFIQNTIIIDSRECYVKIYFGHTLIKSLLIVMKISTCFVSLPFFFDQLLNFMTKKRNFPHKSWQNCVHVFLLLLTVIWTSRIKSINIIIILS